MENRDIRFKFHTHITVLFNSIYGLTVGRLFSGELLHFRPAKQHPLVCFSLAHVLQSPRGMTTRWRRRKEDGSWTTAINFNGKERNHSRPSNTENGSKSLLSGDFKQKLCFPVNKEENKSKRRRKNKGKVRCVRRCSWGFFFMPCFSSVLLTPKQRNSCMLDSCCLRVQK